MKIANQVFGNERKELEKFNQLDFDERSIVFYSESSVILYPYVEEIIKELEKSIYEEIKSSNSEIIDDIKGRFKSAELQWILKPGNWHLNGESISLDNTEISMDSNNKFISRLEEHFESIYYMEKTMVPILKIKIS